MGYATQIPYSYMQFSGFINAQAIGTIATDYDINNITLPEWKDPLTYAFIDYHVHQTRDSSGANNRLVSGWWGIEDTGSTFRTAGTVQNGTLWTGANATCNGEFIVPGFTNVAQYLTSGATQLIKFKDLVAAGANLQLQGLYATIRMYFMRS